MDSMMSTRTIKTVTKLIQTTRKIKITKIMHLNSLQLKTTSKLFNDQPWFLPRDRKPTVNKSKQVGSCSFLKHTSTLVLIYKNSFVFFYKKDVCTECTL